jgi:hypothetical protein
MALPDNGLYRVCWLSGYLFMIHAIYRKLLGIKEHFRAEEAGK